MILLLAMLSLAQIPDSGVLQLGHLDPGAWRITVREGNRWYRAEFLVVAGQQEYEVALNCVEARELPRLWPWGPSWGPHPRIRAWSEFLTPIRGPGQQVRTVMVVEPDRPGSRWAAGERAD